MGKIHRRDFNAIVGRSMLTGAIAGALQGAEAADFSPEVTQLKPNGWVPNNSRLPVLHYRSVLLGDNIGNRASALEAMFTEHGWPPQWRNGIYTYHHYHSTAHEVLGFAAGTARVVLGGPNGIEVVASAGDVVVLPAGTGHCQIEASGDYLVIGAYPPDQRWDICRSAPDEPMAARMASLPFPASDPVTGASGPLTRLWTKA